jgi:hypothetical protein
VIAVLVAGMLAMGAPSTVADRFAHNLCRAAEVSQPRQANYDSPPWNDELGAQVGTWTVGGNVIGYAYAEDGLAYSNARLADICPVYP